MCIVSVYWTIQISKEKNCV